MMNESDKGDAKDAITFYRTQIGPLFVKWPSSDQILKKSLGRPHPHICTGVNGENLQFMKYQFCACVSSK